MCGSPLQPSASVTLSLQLAAGHSAVVVVVVVDSRGGWRRGETGEISLRFHGADLNRRKRERERERDGRDGKKVALPLAIVLLARNRATFRRSSRCLAGPTSFRTSVNEFFSTSRWKLSSSMRRFWSLIARKSREFPGLSPFSPSEEYPVKRDG